MKNRVSFIRADKTLYVDNYALEVDVSNVPPHICAFHLNTEYDHIEDLDGKNLTRKIDWFYDLIKQHEKKKEQEELAQEEANKESMKQIEYRTKAEELEKDFKVVSVTDCYKVISKGWLNITLKLRKNRSEKTIGILIADSSGIETDTGVKTLNNYKKIFAEAKEYGIPVFGDLQPKIIDRERFCKFFEKCGCVVTRFPDLPFDHMVYKQEKLNG
jgi:hypothetical protein